MFGFFLIFAQFAFVEILRARDVGLLGEKILLSAMAVAGIAAGFVVAWRGASTAGLRAALALSAVAAAVAAVPGGFAAMLLVALLTGMGVGAATVSAAALLPSWCTVAWVGAGTGLGYAVCNLPWVFTAPPETQAWVGTGLAVVGAALVPSATEGRVMRQERARGRLGWLAGIVVFLAMVWLDSAAFFIIQHGRQMKEATWGGGMLWRNAGLHLVAGCLAGWWLSKGGWKGLLLTAWGILAVAAVLVNQQVTRGVAGWWYPVGVSLYSTALVAWPGFLSASGAGRTKSAAMRAAWVFAVAGWFGSANGIGMAQTLERVPTSFVVVSGILVIGSLAGIRRWPGILGASLVMIAASVFPKRDESSAGTVERGRQVYVEEGCIACHSRYVRPSDPGGWGPPSDPAGVLSGSPVLIGNRRQGPDLTHVGARRSAAWLKEHFLSPRKLVPGSSMPSYAHLFEDGRGDDLIAWLTDNQGEAIAWRMERMGDWKAVGEPGDGGAALFSRHCAVCHGARGLGDGELAGRFAKPPANLVEGPFVWSADPSVLPRLIKWGVPGTDMPGHELLADSEVLALAKWLRALRQ
ncbi:bifunctional cbb3-type cytochrome coxidase subunit I/II [Haloferula helveola]|uniref:Bifunctional cbb3-type cytochrome coxidase subunit I/II n=1 Tax=Haloferula helveola TaxID=490095 RepID=A0ABN6H0I6_9BACT|nr:bifunctional cbb3-type cytochrome coxidase subunit I/II [Haloferula helveola]